MSVHATSLLDVYLYVSAANWVATTRPVFSTILPFPLTWTVPQTLRAAAVARTEHLDLADLDSDFDTNASLHGTKVDSTIPSTFLKHLPIKPKKTVQGEMTPEQAAAISLFDEAKAVLGQLEDLRADVKGIKTGARRFFLQAPVNETGRRSSNYPVTSLDCLLFGYLALMREADVPRDWIRTILRNDFRELSQFVDDMKQACYTSKDPFPFTQSLELKSPARIASRFLSDILKSSPQFGEEYTREMRRRKETNVDGIDKRAMILGSGFLLAGLAAYSGYYTYKMFMPFGLRTQTWLKQRSGSKLSDFGDLGDMLNFTLGMAQQQPYA
jgi:sorting and assembly machinery component 37